MTDLTTVIRLRPQTMEVKISNVHSYVYHKIKNPNTFVGAFTARAAEIIW